MSEVDKAYNQGAAISVGAASANAVNANPNRGTLILQNDHATQVIYCSFGGTAVLNTGLRISPAGGTIILQGYTGAISAIATGATTPLLVTEI